MKKSINTDIFMPFLLEKAPKRYGAMAYVMDKDTDVSMYNYISNILTLHYILYIYFISITFYLPLIIPVCVSKEPDFLIWLSTPHLQAFAGTFFHNIDKYEKILGQIFHFLESTEITTNNRIFQVHLLQKNHHFEFKKSLNLFRKSLNQVFRIFPFQHLKLQAKSNFTKFPISLTFCLKSSKENCHA